MSLIERSGYQSEAHSLVFFVMSAVVATVIAAPIWRVLSAIPKAARLQVIAGLAFSDSCR